MMVEGFDSVDPVVPDELKCSFCSKMLNNAVMLPCCAADACESCARSCLDDLNAVCPCCASSDTNPTDLIPNRRLRDKANEFRLKFGIKHDKPIQTCDDKGDCNEELEREKLTAGGHCENPIEAITKINFDAIAQILQLSKLNGVSGQGILDENNQKEKEEPSHLSLPQESWEKASMPSQRETQKQGQEQPEIEETEEEKQQSPEQLQVSQPSIQIEQVKDGSNQNEDALPGANESIAKMNENQISVNDETLKTDEIEVVTSLPDVVKSGTLKSFKEDGNADQIDEENNDTTNNDVEEDINNKSCDESKYSEKLDAISSLIPDTYLEEAKENPLAVFNRIMEARDKQKDRGQNEQQQMSTDQTDQPQFEQEYQQQVEQQVIQQQMQQQGLFGHPPYPFMMTGPNPHPMMVPQYHPYYNAFPMRPRFHNNVKLCHFCHQPGHILRFCPLREGLAQQEQQLQRQSDENRRHGHDEDYRNHHEHYHNHHGDYRNHRRRDYDCSHEEATGHRRSKSPKKPSRSTRSPSSRRSCSRLSPLSGRRQRSPLRGNQKAERSRSRSQLSPMRSRRSRSRSRRIDGHSPYSERRHSYNKEVREESRKLGSKAFDQSAKSGKKHKKEKKPKKEKKSKKDRKEKGQTQREEHKKSRVNRDLKHKNRGREKSLSAEDVEESNMEESHKKRRENEFNDKQECLSSKEVISKQRGDRVTDEKSVKIEAAFINGKEDKDDKDKTFLRIDDNSAIINETSKNELPTKSDGLDASKEDQTIETLPDKEEIDKVAKSTENSSKNELNVLSDDHAIPSTSSTELHNECSDTKPTTIIRPFARDRGSASSKSSSSPLRSNSTSLDNLLERHFARVREETALSFEPKSMKSKKKATKSKKSKRKKRRRSSSSSSSSSSSDCEDIRKKPRKRLVTVDSSRLLKNPLRCAAKKE